MDNGQRTTNNEGLYRAVVNFPLSVVSFERTFCYDALMVLKRTPASETPVRPVSSSQTDTAAFEQTLRPRALTEYIGQSKIKGHLIMHIEAAKSRKEPLGHT